MTNRRLLWALIAAVILVPVNSTMMAVGMVFIARGVHASLASVVWVVTVYLIIMAAAQPITGKLGDLFGARRLLMAGLVVFGLSSMAAATLPYLWALIICRAGQALGGALIVPNAMAILRRASEQDALRNALGTVSLSQGLGAALGPILGSMLIQWAGWTAMFWVNVPLVALALIRVYRECPQDEAVGRPLVDSVGAISLAVFLGCLALAVPRVHSAMWPVALPIAIGVGGLFVWAERRAHDPIVRWGLFRIKAFRSANFSILVNNFFMYGILLFIPIYLKARPQGIQDAGELLFILSLTMSGMSWVGSRIAHILGRQRIILLAFGVDGLVVFWLLALTSHAGMPYLVMGMVISGIGVGLGVTTMQLTALESVDLAYSGASSGIFSTFRYVGSILASALLSLIVGDFTLRWITFATAACMGIVLSQGFTIRRSNHPPDQFLSSSS